MKRREAVGHKKESLSKPLLGYFKIRALKKRKE